MEPNQSRTRPSRYGGIIRGYITTTITAELAQRSEVFSQSKRNAFWIVDSPAGIVGSFGIESHSQTNTELRRMSLDRGYRGLGIAKRMLDCAEGRAHALGFRMMIASTAEIQKAPHRICAASERSLARRASRSSPFGVL